MNDLVPPSAAPDVKEAFREVHRAIEVLIGARNVDLHGRRLINAGASIDDADYVTKAELSRVAVPGVGGSGKTILPGAGIGVTESPTAVTVSNSGVRSVAGTANQVVASASTGAVTLSTPQSIATTSTPQFARIGLGAAADGTALVSVAGKLLMLADGTASKYGNVATAGWGLPAIYGHGHFAGQTALKASVATYTVGAADGLFLIGAHVDVNTSTAHSFTVTVVYTDPGGTSRTLTLSFTQLGGATPIATITNVTGVGPYEGLMQTIRAKAATAITIATAGTFTTVNYDVDGSIIQLG